MQYAQVKKRYTKGKLEKREYKKRQQFFTAEMKSTQKEFKETITKVTKLTTEEGVRTWNRAEIKKREVKIEKVRT